MYPLNLLMVNCRGEVLGELRKELAKMPITVEAEFANANSVIAALPSWQDQTRLFVLYLSKPEDLPYLKRLHDAFPAWPILALPQMKVDAPLMMRLMRDGATQIVSVPIPSEDFREAMDRIGVQYGYSSKTTRMIAVSGVTGGCGASTLAINLAAEVGHLRKTPGLLFEAAFRVGALSSLLDIEPRFTSYELYTSIEHLDLEMVKGALVKINENFSILVGPKTIATSLRIGSREVLQMINHLRLLTKVLIVDLPCTYDDFYFDLVSAMDQVVLVGEQTVPSIRALKLVHVSMVRDERSRLRDIVKHVVVNRYDSRMKGFDSRRLETLLEVPQLTCIPDDVAVKSATNAGHLLRQDAPRSPALTEIDRLVDALVPAEDAPKKGDQNTLTRFLRVFGKK